MPSMHKYYYPIETEKAREFWASRHKCNRMKAIIAFSPDLYEANHNLKRMGYKRMWRLKALNNFGAYVAQPDMARVPLSSMEVPWWKCMPYTVGPLPPIGKLVLWLDAETWVDTKHWTEVEEETPPTPDPNP